MLFFSARGGLGATSGPGLQPYQGAMGTGGQVRSCESTGPAAYPGAMGTSGLAETMHLTQEQSNYKRMKRRNSADKVFNNLQVCASYSRLPTPCFPPPTSYLPPPPSYLLPPTSYLPSPNYFTYLLTSFHLHPTSYYQSPTSYHLPPTSYA